MTVALCDTGTGNLRSVAKALAAAGANVELVRDPDLLRTCDKVVVPGQGAFADCMSSLHRYGMDEALVELISRGVPYFGICLGMQILFEESDEVSLDADADQPLPRGLGLLPGRVAKLEPDDPTLKIPHMGWNEVWCTSSNPSISAVRDGSHFYFVHSYVVQPELEQHAVLTCDYGGSFCAAVRHDNLFACQFHPEKSQQVGLALLEGFVSNT